MSFKTGECSEEERDGFYPVTLYCEKCGKMPQRLRILMKD